MVVISLMIMIVAIALTSSSISNKSNSIPVSQREGDIVFDSLNKNLHPAAKAEDRVDSEVRTEGISPILFTRLTSIVFIFSGVLSYNALYIQSIGSGISIYSGLYQITVLSQSFDIIIFTLAALILIPWSNNIKSLFFNENNKYTTSSPAYAGVTVQQSTSINTYISVAMGPKVKEYSLIVLFSTLGSSLLLSSNNLLSLYLSLELQSFGVYILASIYRDSESSTNAGLKYFLLGGLSSCLILLGCVLIYSYTGIINIEDINSLLLLSNIPSSAVQHTGGVVEGYELFSSSPYTYGGEVDIITIVQLGLILIFIGFLFKIAGAPFHNWAPDVYNDVPSIVTTWLTIMPKIAIIILSLDIINIINLDVLFNSSVNINLVKNLFLISSFLSLLIGTVVGLAQNKIKRLLAYSTISHIGFILLALSVNTEESLESVLFYLIQYSFTNLNIFFIVLAFGYILKSGKLNSKNSMLYSNGSDISFISELKGQFKDNPILTLSLAVSLFSMAGIPPLLGFFAKAGVLYSSIQNGYYFISLVAIIVSVISAYYYLAIIKVMHFDTIPTHEHNHSTSGNSANASNPTVGTGYRRVTNIHSFIIAILTLSILFFILKPSIILNSIHLIALNIFYF